MRKFIFSTLLMSSFMAFTNNQVTKLNIKDFPSELAYTASLKDDVILKDTKHHKIDISYFRKGQKIVLLKETHNKILVSKNKINLYLGKGKYKKSKYQPLQQIFAKNTEIEMLFEINGIKLHPKVGILPAGHSQETSALLAGNKKDNNGKHWKAYKRKGSQSSFQSIELSSSDYNSYHPKNERVNPFTAKMKGPFISKPLYSLPATRVKAFQQSEINKPRHEDLFDNNGVRYGTGAQKINDPLAAQSQLSGAQSSLTAPVLLSGFQGMPNISGFLPPDTEGAVGPNHYVQQVNSTTQIFLKNGTPTGPAVDTNTLWSAMPITERCRTDNSGDAIALYDEQADRWVLTQFAVDGSPEQVCFAVSQTSDPTGAYYLYSLVAQRFPDYYKLGVWPAANNNAYFMGTNSGGQGQYDVYALDREKMLIGNPGDPPRAAQFFQSFPNLLMPADNDGELPPPVDEPGYLYTIRDGGEAYFGSPPNDSIDIYEFIVDWDTPSNTTLTLTQSITNTTGLQDFNWTVCGFFESNCIPQLGSSTLIDSNSWWPQQRFQYRNYGIYGSLVGVWGVNAVAAPAKHTAPRWFELRKHTTDLLWTIRQQGTYAPDANHRFSPSISMDESHNIGLGYSETSATMFPSISYTIHDNDLNLLGDMEAEGNMFSGLSAQSHSSGRWGDYASMEVDPSDSCTFWFTTEYIESNNWKTYIGSFKAPDCKKHNILIYDDYSDNHDINVCQSDGTATYEMALSYDFDTSTTMTVNSGCPAGATCGFTNSPAIYPTDPILQISNLGAAALGSYSIIISASATGGKLDTEDFSLNILDSNIGTSTLLSPANTATSTPRSSTFTWSVATGATSYTLEIASDNAFTTNLQTFTGITTTSYALTSKLDSFTTYYWRVTANQPCASQLSAVFSFTTVSEVCTVINYSGIPIALNDASGNPNNPTPGVTTSTLNTAAIETVSDVNVLNLAGTHTWIGDMRFEVLSPAGTTVSLMEPLTCTSEQDFNIYFDDDVAPGPWPCPPTDGSTYQPNGNLSDFINEPTVGDWVLRATDVGKNDTGFINSWSLEICYVPSSPNQDPVVDTAILDQANAEGDTVNLNTTGNFSDPDIADTLSFSMTGSLPAGLGFTNGVITGTIDFAASGSSPYSVTVTASDGNGGSVADTFAWTVSNSNRAPTAVKDSYTVDEDTTLTILIANGLLDNDSDPDSDPISAVLDSQPSNGAVSLNSDGSFTYSPNENYCNTDTGSPDTFQYHATDGNLNSNTETVSITVNCIVDTYTVSVDVSNLLGTGFELQLNSNEILPITSGGLSTFSTTLSEVVDYSVIVISHPTEQYCTVSNNTGSSVVDVTLAVSCGPSAIFSDGFED